MKACILAGGLGERLKPLTDDLPKVMLPLGDGRRPLLEYLVRGLASHGVKEIILCVSYHKEKIADHFGYGEKFGVKISYSVDPEFLGTAGSVKQLQGQLKETFLVVYGDVASKLDYAKVIDFHRQRKGLGTLVLHESDHPRDSDLAELDASGRITFFGRRPDARRPPVLTNAGCYVLEPAVLQGIPASRKLDFGRDVFPGLVAVGKPLYGHITSDYMKDIGTMERYQRVKEEFGRDR